MTQALEFTTEMLPRFIFIYASAVLGFVFSKNKYVNIYICLVVLVMVALSHDYEDNFYYEGIFKDTLNNGEGYGYEILFVFINRLISYITNDYIIFRWIFGSLYVSGLYLIIRRLTIHPNMVWGALLIYPALWDAITIRNSLSMVISMLALLKLIECKNIKQSLLPLGLFIIAALNHSSYWITVVFVPLWFILKKPRGRVWLLSGVVVAAVVCSVFPDLLFNIFSSLSVRESAVKVYQTGEYANINGMIYNVLKYITIISPALLFKRRGRVFYTPRNDDSENMMNNIIRLNLLCSILLVPQSFAVAFSRLYKMIIIFNYCFLANLVKKKDSSPFYFLIFYSVYLALIVYFWETPENLIYVLFMHLSTNDFLRLI